MTVTIKKLEELANAVADAHKELASEIEAICAEEGVTEDHHPLHHSAQNILRLEWKLSALIKAMASEGFDGNTLKNDLKNIYLQRIIADANFKKTGFARVLVNAGTNN
jgi:hypothetical protein